MDNKMLVKLQDFVNFEELEPLDDQEKLEENVEMTEQEVESLFSILNSKEISKIENPEVLGISQEDMTSSGISQVILLSLVPKFPESYKFIFEDKVMKNDIQVHALPPLELLIALPNSYPSN